MRKIILKSMAIFLVISAFSGCMSEDEKKAKDITVKNILEEENRKIEKEQNKGKHPDWSNFNFKIEQKK